MPQKTVKQTPKTVISPQHAISEDLDIEWRNFVFTTGGSSTYHKEIAMRRYLIAEASKDKKKS